MLKHQAMRKRLLHATHKMTKQCGYAHEHVHIHMQIYKGKARRKIEQAEESMA